MTDVAEILAVLDELEPWPQEWPQGEQEALEVYPRVSRARQAAAATYYGMTPLQVMRAERNRPTKEPK